MRSLGSNFEPFYFYFFYGEILQTKKAKKQQNANKQLSLRYFYTPKKFKKQTSDFHS